MKKILIVYNEIQHYRIDFFRELSKKYDLTILHSGKLLKNESSFTQIVVKCHKFGPFRFQSGVLKCVYSGHYDATIFLFDVAWISTLIAVTTGRLRTKIILWGAWYTKSSNANLIRTFYSKLANANIFYSPNAKHEFQKNGVSASKCFVANNTFKVEKPEGGPGTDKRFRILAIGSMDTRKRYDIVIRSFNRIHAALPKTTTLTFIGDGYEYSNLSTLANELGLAGKVEFLGRIEAPNQLADFYDEAVVSVSYGQAGLSVLQALGFGIPFITQKGAISGGEIENIKHDENGYLCESETDLDKYLIEICTNEVKAEALRENALKHYQKHCTIENMVAGFVDAIEFNNA